MKEYIIIDKLSIVSSDLWIDIDSMLREIFMVVPEKAWAGLSVMAIADFLELPLVLEKIKFSQFSDKASMKTLLGLHLRH